MPLQHLQPPCNTAATITYKHCDHLLELADLGGTCVRLQALDAREGNRILHHLLVVCVCVCVCV